MIRSGVRRPLIIEIGLNTGILIAAAPHSRLAPTQRTNRAAACTGIPVPNKNSSDRGGTEELRARH